ncbi:hypothetical protein KQ51_00570 [Candidatus Izimaplasma bacterium HR1]|jgi:hypothetical protein|uniref:SHOCT-like domain-containing protein n=1 Tax=Candidatus Izimoplasma sp. HR1 TaxID=1541959 RepID=UPI0004F873AC|nr:hypothetical protein KQ51_00570 [Candidatus Izimaplasma bacterium HR1]
MNDKLRILEMIENKTITAAEGAELLKALDQNETKAIIRPKKEAFKMFKIKVLSADGDKVNVQIPIEFAKVALSSGKGFMKMDQIEGLDLDFEQILNMIDTGMLGKIVDVESADGDIVEIVIE